MRIDEGSPGYALAGAVIRAAVESGNGRAYLASPDFGWWCETCGTDPAVMRREILRVLEVGPRRVSACDDEA